MKVYRYGAKVLREKAEPVKWSPEIRNFIMEMFRTMKAESGVGLAAPQVGKSSRIIIIDVGEGPMAFINPEIIDSIESFKEALENFHLLGLFFASCLVYIFLAIGLWQRIL